MPPPPERKAAAAPLRQVRARLDFDLHPSTAGDVLEGMQQELNGMLNRYNHQFGGVVMGFSQEKALGHHVMRCATAPPRPASPRPPQARIHHYFPYLSVKATALLTLFSPQPGDIMEAGTGVLGDEEAAGKKKFAAVPRPPPTRPYHTHTPPPMWRSGGKLEADGDAGKEAGKKRRKSKEGKASKARAAEGDEAAGERKSGEKKKGKEKKAKEGDKSKGGAERAEKEESAKPSAESKKKEKKAKKAEEEAAKAGGKEKTEGEAEKGGGGDAPLKSEEKAGKARKPTKDKKEKAEKSEAKEEKKSEKAKANRAKRRLDADGVVAAEPAKKRKKDKH
eukprot:jgi/Tetstr1/433767/TSEL_022984.t1